MIRVQSFAVVCLFAAGVVWATVFGTVRGVAHDPSHRPVAGAEVTLRAQGSAYQQNGRTDIDDPKTDGSKWEVAIPPQTAELLREWMESAAGPEPDAYVFGGETGKPVWRDTLLYDHIRPELKPHGPEWVDFQVMRATHASIGHRLKLDPKVTADQRGHGVGVAIEEYTKTSL